MIELKFLCLYLLIILSSSQVQNQKCMKVVCQTRVSEKDKCVEISEDKETAIMRTCPNSKFCFVQSDEPNENAECVNKPTDKHKGYPGMSCQENEDCFKNQCINNVCVGVMQNEECSYVEDCEYGFTCRKVNDKKICTIPLEKGECSSDTECKLTHGCYKKNCIPYYSLDNEVIIDDIIESPQFSFCKSGYSNPNRMCSSLNLLDDNVKCDESHPCRYGNDMIIPENCRCGYNPNGDSYCLLGSGHYNYTRYVTKVKEYYFSKGKCHLAERGGEGCLMDLYQGSLEIKDIIGRMYNSKLWALSNNKLIESPLCALTIELPKYDPSKDEKIPEPETPKCAVYQCLEKQGNCAKSSFKSVSDIKVTLSDICDESSYCSVDGKPNEIFYQSKDVTGKCELRTVSKTKRYPGEDCIKDADCTKSMYTEDEKLGKCINNKCSGYKEGESCKSTEMCLAGYYCNLTDNKCKIQSGINKECKSSYDCKNNLLCNHEKCQDVLYSIEPGNVIDSGDQLLLSYYCAFATNYERKCVKYTEKNKPMNTDYTSCLIGSWCEYQYEPATFGVMTQRCDCGYNSKGQGYCPKGQESDESGWRNYYSALKKQYDNKCHSVSRFQCYLKDEKVMNEVSYYRNKVFDGHLYYNSESCAQKVLSSFRLSISMLVLVAYISLLP